MKNEKKEEIGYADLYRAMKNEKREEIGERSASVNMS